MKTLAIWGQRGLKAMVLPALRSISIAYILMACILQ